ncbi:hypothetical protein GM418_10645 [Maribellus comscasis]|uniref:Glycoside hydrolase n=1 Tax=Maribellus comscasis TaxID=2681766 RepID=A0A6I6JSN9_9BACT|nr:hypothetical protein [Maribellus comscasis]QGY44098.1 hypothetical protein GM418_10645 [Maribellus comscasis]
MKKILLTAIVAFLFVSVGGAAGIDGKWKTSMEGPQGKMEMTFVFKVNGEKLTGTVSTPMGEMKITNGKVSGNDFSFDLKMGDHSMGHTGKLDGKVIKLKVEMPEGGPQGGGGQGGPGGPPEMTLTKVE